MKTDSFLLISGVKALFFCQTVAQTTVWVFEGEGVGDGDIHSSHSHLFISFRCLLFDLHSSLFACSFFIISPPLLTLASFFRIRVHCLSPSYFTKLYPPTPLHTSS